MLTGLQICFNYLLVQPRLSETTRLVFLCVYTSAQLAVAALAVLLTLWDPTDAVVYSHRQAAAEGREFPFSEYRLVCTACSTCVSSQAKHCARCDRCVAGFDHHCKWLNNCIGQCNYRWFWFLVLCLALCTGVQFGFAVSALAGSDSWTEGLLGFHLGLTGIEFLGTLQLMGFHAWLVSKGLTTYEFIRLRRERCEKRRRVQPNRKQEDSAMQESNLTTIEPVP